MCMPDRPSLPGDDHSALCLYSTSTPCDAPDSSSASSSDCASPRPAMSSTANSWGTLINSDKSPAPLLEQLCLGIAQLMPSFDSSRSADLTPERLAGFYRKVGGNYDSLFLETKSQALSFIYQSVGCFHSLQPSNNPYESPSIPSLLPLGFVRWQTIQLLMDPDEHWRYLQNAVKQWNIVDAKGDVFPKEIPRDAFPSEPDPEMLQWHEGVCRKLEYDFVKRQANRASPPNFSPYHYHFSGKESLPDDEDYFSHPPRRAASHRHGHCDSDRQSRRRHHHHRRLSGDHHSSSTRRQDRPESTYIPRPDGGRSGVSTPRVRSPSPRTNRPPRSRGRDRPGLFGHPQSPGMEDGPVFPDIPNHDPPLHEEDLEPPKHKHRSRHRNLSPPSDSRARRHSHDAYMRKPARDLSPSAPRRSYDPRQHKPTVSHSDAAAKSRREDRSHSRTPDVKFREFIFDGPVPAPAPDPPQYAQPPPPPRAVPRRRYNLEPDDGRRGSYSGASAGGSRPGSGGSGSERPRSFSNAGHFPRSSRWTSPVRSSASKRYIPTSVAEDETYPPPRRPIYD